MNRPDHARAVRYGLTNAKQLCERLGLLTRGRWVSQPKGAIVCCPWHDDRTPSCSVRLGNDGTIAVKCHGCGAGGDALSLVAQVHGLSLKRDFKQVLLSAAQLGGLAHLADEIQRGELNPEPPPRPPAPEPEPERTYPPIDEVLGVWESGGQVTDDADATAWVVSRGLDPDAVDGSEVVRVIPKTSILPRWATFRGLSWIETGHRMVFAMRDVHGAIRSIRAGRITDGSTPKRLPPGGHKASGLVLACPLAVAMLAGTWSPTRIVISEGEPDSLVWMSKRSLAPTARIGIVSGSWSDEFALKFPAPNGQGPASVLIRTDEDEAGTRYAKEITPSLRQRGCLVTWTTREVSDA